MSKEPRALHHRPDDADDKAGGHIRMLVEQYAGALYGTALRLTRHRAAPAPRIATDGGDADAPGI